MRRESPEAPDPPDRRCDDPLHAPKHVRESVGGVPADEDGEEPVVKREREPKQPPCRSWEAKRDTMVRESGCER